MPLGIVGGALQILLSALGGLTDRPGLRLNAGLLDRCFPLYALTLDLGLTGGPGALGLCRLSTDLLFALADRLGLRLRAPACQLGLLRLELLALGQLRAERPERIVLEAAV